jgi:hypothetical protein
MDTPALYRGALSQEERRRLLESLPALGRRFRMGRYVYLRDDGTVRPFMHSCHDRYGLDWATAYRWVEKHPGGQWGCRVQINRTIHGKEFETLRLGCGHWTVPTHFDCVWNLAACALGERAFYLSPPSEEMPERHAIKVTLRAGDALLVPPGWWHEVRNEDGKPSVLINANVDSEHDHEVGRAYERLEALYDKYWPGRAHEQDIGYEDTTVVMSNGYGVAVGAGAHTYKDLLAG